MSLIKIKNLRWFGGKLFMREPDVLIEEIKLGYRQYNLTDPLLTSG